MKKIKMIFISLFFLITSKLFSTTTESMPWEKPLEIVMNSLAGPVTTIIGVIVIVTGGLVIAFTEGAGVKKLGWGIVGIGIAINAARLIPLLFGTVSGFLY